MESSQNEVSDFIFDENAPLEEKTEIKEEISKELPTKSEISPIWIFLSFLLPFVSCLLQSSFPPIDDFSIAYSIVLSFFSIVFLWKKDFQDVIYFALLLSNLASVFRYDDFLGAPLRILVFHFYFRIVFYKIKTSFNIYSLIGIYFGCLSFFMFENNFTEISYFNLPYENSSFQTLEMIGNFFTFSVFFFITLIFFLLFDGILFKAMVSTFSVKFIAPLFFKFLIKNPELLEKLTNIYLGKDTLIDGTVDVIETPTIKKIIPLSAYSGGMFYTSYDPEMAEKMKSIKILNGEKNMEIALGYRQFLYPRDFGETLTVEFSDGKVLSFVDDELVDTFELCKHI